MGLIRKTHNGKLVNPGKTAKRYCTQLKNKSHTVLNKKTGEMQSKPLTKAQASYRMGYVQAQIDSANLFKQKNPRYVRKTR